VAGCSLIFHEVTFDRERLFVKQSLQESWLRCHDNPESCIRAVMPDSDTGCGNPYWTAEANANAETNPEGLRPVDLAKRWGHARIDTPKQPPSRPNPNRRRHLRLVR
jgi:hypothetical protein